MYVKVNIEDKISKLQRYAAQGTKSDKLDGFLSINGKLIETPDETSFQRLSIKDNQLLSLTFESGEGFGEPKRWRRFKDIQKNDWLYNYYNDANAVAFVPKRDIVFFGFGL